MRFKERTSGGFFVLRAVGGIKGTFNKKFTKGNTCALPKDKNRNSIKKGT